MNAYRLELLQGALDCYQASREKTEGVETLIEDYGLDVASRAIHLYRVAEDPAFATHIQRQDDHTALVSLELVRAVLDAPMDRAGGIRTADIVSTIGK